MSAEQFDVKKSDKLTLHLPERGLMDQLRTVLAYESVVRGRSVGQACAELIMEGVDVDAYPDKVKERLEEIREDSIETAISKSVSMTSRERA